MFALFTEQEVYKNWDYLAAFHHASGSGKFSCCYPDDWLGSVIACAVCTFIQKYILCTKQNVKQFPPPLLWFINSYSVICHEITISQSTCFINRMLVVISLTGDQHFLYINSAVKALKATDVPHIRCVMQFSHLCGLKRSTYTLGYGTSCIWGTKYVNVRTSRAL